MRDNMLSSVVAVLIVLAVASASAAEIKAGFRDIACGDPPAAGMVKITEATGLDIYSRSSDKMSIGNAKLAYIGYGFYKNKLHSVLISAEKYEKVTLKTILVEQWGKPLQPNKYIEEFIWRENGVFAYLKERVGAGEVSISITCDSVSAEKTSDEKDAAKKAGSDL